ncbi:phospholipase C [Malassezia cuniculi]|uniref:Phospholipase C n=1 Tax=Malassezia cuniculi TaxID=948313 RepID=A0AAF0J5F2_9BASI|nr:phospholipase C [Malassezia cuniculi]
MGQISRVFVAAALAAAAAGAAAAAAEEGLKKIEHIVLFMQENRAFDHYFGTMAGVRGFQDPNAHVSKNTGKSVFYQPVDGTIEDAAPPKNVSELLPWYVNYEGGDWAKRTQCMIAGSNDWRNNQAAWNKGEIDRWALNNTPYSMGYLKREDLPVHFTLAEEFVVGDSYYESVISSTSPNRVAWISGSINTEGSSVGGNNKKLGGPVLDNENTPGCEKTDNGGPMSCHPLRWKTMPEYLQDAGITWQFYQDEDNFGDDPLEDFERFQQATLRKEELAARGTARIGLKRFYADAKAGKLPQVSFIVAPAQLSEHPPYTPNDGAWLQRKVAEAVMHGPKWNSSALILSYDETGGWADHVMAPHASKDTPGEWITDPYNATLGLAPTGPGFRLPFYIVSPYTRRGGVFTEHAAHESQIMFVEEWAKAHGMGFESKEVNAWRRAQLSNLVNAFDFANVDYSVPTVPEMGAPSKDPLTQQYNGGDVCQARYDKDVQPRVPYGEQHAAEALRVEAGHKRVRGDITEGRYLTLEQGGKAVKVVNGTLGVGAVDRKDKSGLFVVHWASGEPAAGRFVVTDYAKKQYVTAAGGLSSKRGEAGEFSIRDRGNGAGHDVESGGKYVGISGGKVVVGERGAGLEIYAVTV